MFDDPRQPFHLLAVAKGYPAPTTSRPSSSTRMRREGQDPRRQHRAFKARYQDATTSSSRRGRPLPRRLGGDAELGQGEGRTLEFGFFAEGDGGWCDSLAIPTTATERRRLCLHRRDDRAEINSRGRRHARLGHGERRESDPAAQVDNIYDYTTLEDPSDGAQFRDIEPPDEVQEGITSTADWRRGRRGDQGSSG